MRQGDITYAINQFLIKKDRSILQAEVDLLFKNYDYTKDDVVDEFYHEAYRWFGEDISVDIEREIKEILGQETTWKTASRSQTTV